MARSFEAMLQKYKKLMRFASWRYSIAGVLPPRDLYQESMIILDDVIKKYDDKSDEEFRKLFKTELWHRLSNVVRKHKAAKRDWRLSCSVESTTELRFAEGGVPIAIKGVQEEVNARQVLSSLESLRTPELELIWLQEREAVDQLLDKLQSILEDEDDYEAVDVLEEILDPTSWEAIPDVFKFPLDSSFKYERVPGKVPRHVVADLLGLPLSRVKRSKKKIKKLTAQLAATDERLPKLACQLNSNKEDHHGN